MVKHQTGSPLPSHLQASSVVSQSSLNTWFPGASRILPPGFSPHPATQLPSALWASAAPPPTSHLPREENKTNHILN